MTNTKFRKRALLSSVAMLLVALVALGSATFAWFTANPNAEADGLSLKTTASAGLVIRTDTDTRWSHEADLAQGLSTFNLDPASQLQTSPFTLYNVIADNSSNYGAKSGESMSTVTAGRTSSNGAYMENIYCRLSDGSDATANASKIVKLTGITITANEDATMAHCIRVAVTRGTTMLGTYALSGFTNNGTLTGANATHGDYTITTAATDLDINTGLTGLTATGTDLSKYITVYVYLDGQDSDTYSDKVGTVNASEIIESIQVDLTLANAA